ncbi:MAG: CoA synthetase, partial [Syntrophomonadaceae bacterium]|nr:CoA synthetase [Syntrophomonadaceae bacterium]
WEIKISPDVKMVPEPTPEELKNLREVDVTGSLRKK